MSNIVVIDTFDSLDLSEYPEFLEIATSLRLNNMHDAHETRSNTLAQYGDFRAEITLRTQPEIMPWAMKRLLSFFIIAVALSQHEKFRITLGKGGFMNLATRYLTLTRHYDAAGYKELADIYYGIVMRNPDLVKEEVRIIALMKKAILDRK